MFSDVLGASLRGVADLELVFTDCKGVLIEDEEGLGRAAFSAEVIALSRLYI